MNDNDISNLDTEYNRYLQIIRPYLGQNLNKKVIYICNAWMQKLSDCKEDEKGLRNKYIFTLCYQLSKGTLEEPFLNIPPNGYLLPLPDECSSEESSTEIECVVIDKDTDTNIIYKNLNTPLSARDADEESFSEVPSNSTHNILKQTENVFEDSSKASFLTKDSVFGNNVPYTFINEKYQGDMTNEAKYKLRVSNLIKKLRQIKKHNVLLNNELQALKNNSNASKDILNVNNETGVRTFSRSSHTHINSLKCKLQEVQDSKNTLIESISHLQETLDFFHSMKSQEIQEIEANHKLEIIKLKTTIREDLTQKKEKELQELKCFYEESINKLKKENLKEIEFLKQDKDSVLLEKYQIIQDRDSEILQLKNLIDELKRNQPNTVNKMLFDKPDTSESSSSKTEELERRLNKMERAKCKSIKAYESKLGQLQRQKHLAECSWQLQLMKQRAQIVSEVADENQVEVTAAIDKLEGKYKEIVASIQATAVQRRMQDQIALDSVIQAISGDVKNQNLQGTSQVGNKTMRSSNKNCNQTCDMTVSSLFHGNKVGGVVVGKLFGDDSIVNEYCLDSDKLGQLFERVHIPQRDTGDNLTKKS